ncbi:aerotolerance regulator BatA [Candidatus Woesearchaeota archaeon]|nr:MAG: aerotolerance regulator BatA [Candidatus Woesearchaeota archaeon]
MRLTFLKPLWLLGLLFVPLVWYWYKKRLEENKNRTLVFSKLALLKKAAENKQPKWRKNLSMILMLIIFSSSIIALADPYFPLKNTKKGVNVILALDVSGSMQETDFSPNRLEAAKRNTLNLIDQLNPNDLVGVITFGQGATTTSYLTNMKERAIEKVKAIKIQATQSFFGGCTGLGCETHIGVGLASAVDMATSIPNKKKVIIFLSDGANNGGVITPDESIAYAKSNDIQVFTIGMGSKKTDAYGRVLLDEALLKKIASNTDGEYFNAVNDDTLKDIYDSLSDKIKREKEDVSIKDLFIFISLISSLSWIYFNYGKRSILR